MGKFIDFTKNIVRRKWFWPVLVVGAIIVIYVVVQAGKPKVTYVTEDAKLGNIKQTVSATGMVTTDNKINLNFNVSGKISEINVKEGDYVTSGQVLAKLDSKNAQISVNQALAALSSAQANLNKLVVGASTEDLEVSKESVDSAKIAYDNAKANYETLTIKLESDIQTLRSTLADSQTNLTNVKATYNQNVSNAQNTALTSMDTNLLLGSIVNSNIGYNLTLVTGITSDQNKIISSQTNRAYAVTAMDSAKALLATANLTHTTTDILAALQQSIKALNYTLASLSDLSDAMAIASGSTGSAITIIDTVRASVQSDQISVSGALTAINTSQQSLYTAENSYQSQLDSATAAVTTAQNNLNAALSNQNVQLNQAKTSMDTALGSYNLALAQYNLKAARPRNVDIASLQAQVRSAAAAVDLARQNLAEYTLLAPVAGTITFVNNTVGEQPVVGTPIISMLGNNRFYIEVDIPESDITKISIDNPVEITLDAYSDNVIFTGKVILIYPAETVVQDVVYYKVKVELDTTQYEIKSSMTANCTILTASKDNVLLIPNRAVSDQNGQKVVKVLQNNKVVIKNVTLGLVGDAGEVEITSGLSAGEKVITLEKTQ